MSFRRGTWLPFGAVRPQSPLLDAVFERYENANKLGKDLENEYISSTMTELCDVVIVAGKKKSLLFGIRAIMAVRCRYFSQDLARQDSVAHLLCNLFIFILISPIFLF